MGSEINRQLATVERILDIREIPGADNIVCATVKGWELVTQRSNNFQIGDLVVYFCIDSLLPVRPEFEFLRDKCYVSAARSVNGEGFRLKTIKLRGQVSQGLILPLREILKEGGLLDGHRFINSDTFTLQIDDEPIDEGLDLTDVLGVKKYEKPIAAHLAGVARGNFPSFIPKTDQERVQNIFNKIKRDYSNHPFEATIKLDGSSMTVYNKKGPVDRFGVCSRNLDLEESEGNSFWKVARKLDLERKLQECGFSFAIQGELYGVGIQGNKENINDQRFAVFDIFNIDFGRYYNAYERQIMCERLELEHAPIIGIHKLSEFETLDDLLKFAEGPSLFAKTREGVVFKSTLDPSISFKVISNSWLLRNDE